MINYIYKYALIALVITTVGCQQDDSLKPNPFFDRNKMANILTDIQIAEAGINQQGLVIDSLNKSMLWHYEYVYKKNNITEKQFNDNYTYYLEEPELLDSVYNDVIKNIAKLRIEKK
ncbi:MAG: DUF4296 domain-containing protein [Bacteroidia bacterium]|jgi:hypothetical protein|nr:DUF4296 domain-containing protein [Bacteroidia bacterium]